MGHMGGRQPVPTHGGSVATWLHVRWLIDRLEWIIDCPDNAASGASLFLQKLVQPALASCHWLCAGVIVNLWFPNWLLALMWVVAMTASNIELVVSFSKYLTLKREAKSLVRQLQNLPGPQSGEEAEASAALRELSGEAVAAVYTQQQQQHGNGNGMLSIETVQQQRSLLDRAQQLVQRAHRIEALALLYPTLYVRDVNQTLQVRRTAPHACVFLAQIWFGTCMQCSRL